MDHAKKGSVGSKIESGSVLIEGGAAFVVAVVTSVNRGMLTGWGSGLDQALDAVLEVVSGDVLGIDVQLVEDHLGDRPFHGVTAASVEALRVGKQGECGSEELPSFLQLGAGVGQLRLDLISFPFDVGQLPLDLLAWPLRIVEQIEQAVFLYFQLVQPRAQALPERTHVALFQEQCIIELATDGSLEVVVQLYRAEVGVDGSFELGDAEVRQITEVLLAAAAEEVKVGAAVALAGNENHAMPAAVTPQQALQPVVMFPLTGTAPASERQDALYPVVGVLSDERWVSTAVLLAVVGDEAAVVAVAQNLVELTERQRFSRRALGGASTEASGVDLLHGFFSGVLAGGEQLDALGDERAAHLVDGDRADHAAVGLGFLDVQVAERSLTDRAAPLGFLAHLVLDVRPAGLGLVLVDGVDDGFHHRCFGVVTHIQHGGDDAGTDLLEVTLDNPGVDGVPKDPIEVVDDHVVDVLLGFDPGDHLLKLRPLVNAGS